MTSTHGDPVAGDTNGANDIFVRDVIFDKISRVSLDSNGVQGNGDSFNNWGPSVSADGRYVAFESRATNLVSGDNNSRCDVFVRDRLTGTTERVSLSFNGVQGNGDSVQPSISADGRYVAFSSVASNLVSGGTSYWQVFVRDRQAGTTKLVSSNSVGGQGIGDSGYPSISADGGYVAFESQATNLVAGGTNGLYQVFIRDLQAMPPNWSA